MSVRIKQNGTVVLKFDNGLDCRLYVHRGVMDHMSVLDKHGNTVENRQFGCADMMVDILHEISTRKPRDSCVSNESI